MKLTCENHIKELFHICYFLSSQICHLYSCLKFISVFNIVKIILTIFPSQYLYLSEHATISVPPVALFRYCYCCSLSRTCLIIKITCTICTNALIVLFTSHNIEQYLSYHCNLQPHFSMLM